MVRSTVVVKFKGFKVQKGSRNSILEKFRKFHLHFSFVEPLRVIVVVDIFDFVHETYTINYNALDNVLYCM